MLAAVHECGIGLQARQLQERDAWDGMRDRLAAADVQRPGWVRAERVDPSGDDTHFPDEPQREDASCSDEDQRRSQNRR